MANIKSAKKRIKVIDKKTARNKRVKDHVKSALKDLDAAIEAKDFDAAAAKLAVAEKKLMQAAAKGTLNKKAAARKVSTLQRQQNKSHPSPPVYKLNTHALSKQKRWYVSHHRFSFF